MNWKTLQTDLSTLPPARRRLVIGGVVAAGFLLASGAIAAAFLWRVAGTFPQASFHQPSRLYGEALRLAPGDAWTAAELAAELAREGYRQDLESPARPGTFRSRTAGESGAGGGAAADLVEVALRRFPTPSGAAGGSPLAVRLADGHIARIELSGRAVESAALEPPLLASFYGPDLTERRPVRLSEVPDEVVQAVLAAEDAGFSSHQGLSFPAIVRALWVNLRRGEVHQGGSTVTQQLAKNLYLSHRRTLRRKLEEAALALFIEARHGKRTILETYLNCIFWGKSGPVNLIGLGAAAQAFFGKEAAELDLAEAATLAGMIRAPADYSPVDHPRAALARRDWVLQRLANLGWVSRERLRRAQAEPLRLAPRAAGPRPIAPYFADYAAQEARTRFHAGDLAEGGYLLFSTLRASDQRQAETALAGGLAPQLPGERRGRQLQGALVSVDPRDGTILAYVGGRDYGRSQFDRASQAHRQAGSAFKPVVYAAAFENRVATPATLLDDVPIVVVANGTSWSPRDYDRGYRGWVTARTALEQSLNVPAVRLALAAGMRSIAALAREMGIARRLAPVPALALGAIEVSPVELAEVYSTLAAGGLRPVLHGLAAVRGPSGDLLPADEPAPPRRVLSAQTAYEVTSLLQGVVDHGTGSAARREGIHERLAGKTGTTNERRDAWFAGYSPDRVSVVWVGYDDNAQTQLSGATAALPIWSRFTAAVRPAGGYPGFVPPPGMVSATIDPTTGELATASCPYRVTEILAEWQAPSEPCRMHAQPAALLAANGLAPDSAMDGTAGSLPRPQGGPMPADPFLTSAAGLPVAALRWGPRQEGSRGEILIRPSRARNDGAAIPAGPSSTPPSRGTTPTAADPPGPGGWRQ